ncbi:hypothetical protein IMG5_092700 [Ichthyophthirius multifiliis]|uniref:Uncharacterized protein n=1 Tax=Ichthyophthirius multifiliis TaxID=5932 RepID=G0QRG8_ICHMU|nr:hypothetical protein IMG5_092700 [Ichthyophthirius multifiliis]EGR32203.1 hypothetical protein IMG5_092700 [Ichthyophthirius multifiliis]|eukprot:XP_004035689.1 hypothetical protein IMG5_092700 [Ichthyophthirius multifiliis]
MTNIQKQGIPAIIQGQNIVLKSETGSGKTLTYLVPLISNLLHLGDQNKISRNDGSYIFVICPTRELCIQCENVAKQITLKSTFIITGTLIGGENPKKEKARLRKGITVLFASPGRILYHLKNTQSFVFDKLKYLVFEESDRTLDMGFQKDLEEIVTVLQQKIDFEKVQKILISANFNDDIEALYLKMSIQNSNGEVLQGETFLGDIKVFILHGNIQQKVRSETYFNFKKYQGGAILVSTDVASRGLDFPEVTHSILFDAPTSISEYCNRIGRTARIDSKGISLLILNNVEKPYIDKMREFNINLKSFNDELVIEATQELIQKKYNINMDAFQYVESLIRQCTRNDKSKYILARRAYVSSLRAYAMLKDKDIFRVKLLNLKALAKGFGVGNVKAGNETKSDRYQQELAEANKNRYDKMERFFNEKAERVKNQRKPMNTKQLFNMEFM